VACDAGLRARVAHACGAASAVPVAAACADKASGLGAECSEMTPVRGVIAGLCVSARRVHARRMERSERRLSAKGLTTDMPWCWPAISSYSGLSVSA
jgi:hypothetical protein